MIRGPCGADGAGVGVRARALLLSRRFPLQPVKLVIRKRVRVRRLRGHRAVPVRYRRALSHLGRSPFFAPSPGRKGRETIEEVLTATGLLAQGRVGALIILEREIGLRNYWERNSPRRGSQLRSHHPIFRQAHRSRRRGEIIVETGSRRRRASLPLTVSRNSIGIWHTAPARHWRHRRVRCDAVVVSEERGKCHSRLTARLNAA